MKLRVGIIACVALLGLADCSGPRPPVNPPQLISSNESDLAIQLFVQATFMMAKYYGFETKPYTEIADRSVKAGFNRLPFMPPVTVSAMPPAKWEKVIDERTPEQFKAFIDSGVPASAIPTAATAPIGEKNLVKYYIKTGWKAAQIVCRNYLLGLEEQNRYLQFLKEELGVGFGIAGTVLDLANANGTLKDVFRNAQTYTGLGIAAYEKYQFSIDPEGARVLVETAQNKYALHFLKLVDDPNIQFSDPNYDPKVPFTFSEALSAISTIEYQCTRSGIVHLLNRSINNTPTNLKIDDLSGTVYFESAKDADDGSTTPPAAKKETKKGARRSIDRAVAAAQDAARDARIAAATAKAAARDNPASNGEPSARNSNDSADRKKPKTAASLGHDIYSQ